MMEILRIYVMMGDWFKSIKVKRTETGMANQNRNPGSDRDKENQL